MPTPLRVSTDSVEETREVGEAVAALLSGGDVVSLTGDLGAGKTAFVQGAARGLDVREPVLSPTFTLVREYEGRVRVYHLDVYRLERIQDVLDLGFDEMIDRDGVVFIEWGDAIDALLPDDALAVELTLLRDGERRSLAFAAAGERWALRWERLEQALTPWRAD